MVVISKAVLKEFAEKHLDVEAALIKWFILFVRTHREYDKIDASKVQFKK